MFTTSISVFLHTLSIDLTIKTTALKETAKPQKYIYLEQEKIYMLYFCHFNVVKKSFPIH